MSDALKKYYEIKCDEARYRVINHPLRRGLKAIRAWEHRYEGYPIYSGSAFGGLHDLAYGIYYDMGFIKEWWQHQLSIAINVAHITNISGVLHLDCAFGRWFMEKRGLSYSQETETDLCFETAIISGDFFSHYAPDIPRDIFLHHDAAPYDAFLYNPASQQFEPFPVPLIPKPQLA